jgi:hypothetical protein
MVTGLDGLEYCFYNTAYDNCTGETEYCWASFSVDGTVYDCDCMTDEGAQCAEIVESLGGEVADDDEDDEEYCELYDGPHDCAEIDSSLDWCHYDLTYNNCTGDLTFCSIEFSLEGEEYNGECQDFASWFDLTDFDFSGDFDFDDSDDEEECETTCEEEYSCSELYGLDYCMMQDCYDECAGEQSCSASWTYDGRDYDDYDCHYFNQWFENIQTPEECIETKSDSCLNDTESIGATYCWYDAVYDTCLQEEISCNATVTIDGQDYQGTCDELQEQFGLTDDEDDEDDEEECGVVTFPTYDCLDDLHEVGGLYTYFESCVIEVTLDTCTEDITCYAEADGQLTGLESGPCSDFEDVFPEGALDSLVE